MSDSSRNNASGRWFTSNVGTGSGVTVTKAAVANKRWIITSISASGDAAALLTVTFTTGGVSTTWKQRYAGSFVLNHTFPPGEITGDPNTAVSIAISASTSNCEANIAGYSTGG